MPTIIQDGPFTILMEFEVAPGRQREMIEGVTAIVARNMSRNPGLIASCFHAAEDGTHVYNYAQWISREAWQAASVSGPANPVSVEIVAVLDRCGGRRNYVRPLEVVRIVEGAGALASA